MDSIKEENIKLKNAIRLIALASEDIFVSKLCSSFLKENKSKLKDEVIKTYRYKDIDNIRKVLKHELDTELKTYGK